MKIQKLFWALLLSCSMQTLIWSQNYQLAPNVAAPTTTGTFELGFAYSAGTTARYVLCHQRQTYFYAGFVEKPQAIEVWDAVEGRYLGAVMAPSRDIIYAANHENLAAFLTAQSIHLYRFDTATPFNGALMYGSLSVNATAAALTSDALWLGTTNGRVWVSLYRFSDLITNPGLLPTVATPDHPMPTPPNWDAQIQLASLNTRITTLRANPYATNQVVVGTDDGYVFRLVYNPSTQKINILGKPARHSGPIVDVVFYSATRYAVGVADSTVYVYDGEDMRYAIRDRRTQLQPYQMSAYTDGNNQYLVLGSSLDARVYNLSNRALVGTIGSPLAWNSANELLIPRAHSWPSTTGYPKLVPQLLSPHPAIGGLTGGWTNRDIFQSTRIVGNLRLLERREIRPPNLLTPVYAMAVNQQTGKLAIGYANGLLVIYDLSSPNYTLITQRNLGQGWPIHSLDWGSHQRGETLVVSHSMGQVSLYDVSSNNWLDISLSDVPIYALHVLPDDNPNDTVFHFAFGDVNGNVGICKQEIVRNSIVNPVMIRQTNVGSPVYVLSASSRTHRRLECLTPAGNRALLIDYNNNFALQNAPPIGASGYAAYNGDMFITRPYVVPPNNHASYAGLASIVSLDQQKVWRYGYGSSLTEVSFVATAVGGAGFAVGTNDGLVAILDASQLRENPLVGFESSVLSKRLREVYEPRALGRPIYALASWRDWLISGDSEGFTVIQRRIGAPLHDELPTHSRYSVNFNPHTDDPIYPSYPVPSYPAPRYPLNNPVRGDVFFQNAVFVTPRPDDPDERNFFVFDGRYIFTVLNNGVYGLGALPLPPGTSWNDLQSQYFWRVYWNPQQTGERLFAHRDMALVQGNSQLMVRSDLYRLSAVSGVEPTSTLTVMFPNNAGLSLQEAHSAFGIAYHDGGFFAAIAVPLSPVRVYSHDASGQWGFHSELPLTIPRVSARIILRFLAADLLAVAYRPTNDHPSGEYLLEIYRYSQAGWQRIHAQPFSTGLTNMRTYGIDYVTIDDTVRVVLGGREGLTFYAVNLSNYTAQEVGRSHAQHNNALHIHDCYWVRFNRRQPNILGIASLGRTAIVNLDQVNW